MLLPIDIIGGSALPDTPSKSSNRTIQYSHSMTITSPQPHFTSNEVIVSPSLFSLISAVARLVSGPILIFGVDVDITCSCWIKLPAPLLAPTTAPAACDVSIGLDRIEKRIEI